MYKSMICPIFDYGDIVYEGGTQNRLDKLKRTQKIDTLELHRQAGISQLCTRRQSNLKKYMYLQQDNVKYVVDRNIPTRAHGATVFETCIPRIEKYKKGCIYRGIKTWNEI